MNRIFIYSIIFLLRMKIINHQIVPHQIDQLYLHYISVDFLFLLLYMYFASSASISVHALQLHPTSSSKLQIND